MTHQYPTRTTTLLLLLSLVHTSFSQGFPASSSTWSLPAGGDVYNDVVEGFDALSGAGYDAGSDVWTTIDINGDDLVDLVCTGRRVSDGGATTEFSPNNNSYWKVFLGPLSTLMDVTTAPPPIRIAPNPSMGAIAISSDDRMEEVELLDMSRRIVQRVVPMAFAAQLDPGFMRAGMYVVRPSPASSMSAAPIIITHCTIDQ